MAQGTNRPATGHRIPSRPCLPCLSGQGCPTAAQRESSRTTKPPQAGGSRENLEELHCWRETEAGMGWDALTPRDTDSVFHATPHPMATPV